MCVRVHACVCVCARMCARTRVDACVSEHYSCVYRCLSVAEARAGERGGNVSVRFVCIYFIFIVYFKCTFLSPCVEGNISFL